jgi:TRAP-type uncharacterized transport system fused permease subunit
LRQLTGWQKWLIGIWLAAISLFQLYTASFGIEQPRVQRGIHLLFLLPAAFILFPAVKKKVQDAVPLYDWLLAASGPDSPGIPDLLQ